MQSVALMDLSEFVQLICMNQTWISGFLLLIWKHEDLLLELLF